MDELVKANNEAYIRLVVTRGPGNLGLNPFQCAAPVVFILNEGIPTRKLAEIIVRIPVHLSARSAWT